MTNSVSEKKLIKPFVAIKRCGPFEPDLGSYKILLIYFEISELNGE